MSQHHYFILRDGKDISVVAGWDRRLQHLFLSVKSELPVPEDLD